DSSQRRARLCRRARWQGAEQRIALLLFAFEVRREQAVHEVGELRAAVLPAAPRKELLEVAAQVHASAVTPTAQAPEGTPTDRIELSRYARRAAARGNNVEPKAVVARTPIAGSLVACIQEPARKKLPEHDPERVARASRIQAAPPRFLGR